MSEPVSYAHLRGRLYLAASGMFSVVFVSAAGYYVLGEGRWSITDCLYMTVITLATVGYGEMLPGMSETDFARLWTVGVILCGSGILLYWVSSFTAIIVEGDLRGSMRRRRMDKRIVELRGHMIVCGAGTTGVHAIHELVETKTPFVVIDHDSNRLDEFTDGGGNPVLHVVGEATDDATLLAAGIERASGVLVMLHDDRDNLFCTLSARALNARVRIISKAVEHSSIAKLMRAGADRVVSPNYIGGMRLASELVRPTVVEFLDIMLKGDDRLRIEEIQIPEGTRIDGCPLSKSRLRDATNALVLAVREPPAAYHFNPGSDFIVRSGMTLIVMAHMEEVMRLRRGILDGSIGA